MIYITGDTHISVDIQKLSTKRFPQQKEMTNNDYVIICGDFGGVWDDSFENTDVITYQDPEWQAKALAGEIMCPHELIKSLSVDEIAEKCGVSLPAAEYNLNH